MQSLGDDLVVRRIRMAAPPAGELARGQLKAEDWVYLGEGRMHVVCQYKGDVARYKDHVLRVVKVRVWRLVVRGGFKIATYGGIWVYWIWRRRERVLKIQDA